MVLAGGAGIAALGKGREGGREAGGKIWPGWPWGWFLDGRERGDDAVILSMLLGVTLMNLWFLLQLW